MQIHAPVHTYTHKRTKIVSLSILHFPPTSSIRKGWRVTCVSVIAIASIEPCQRNQSSEDGEGICNMMKMLGAEGVTSLARKACKDARGDSRLRCGNPMHRDDENAGEGAAMRARINDDNNGKVSRRDQAPSEDVHSPRVSQPYKQKTHEHVLPSCHHCRRIRKRWAPGTMLDTQQSLFAVPLPRSSE